MDILISVAAKIAELTVEPIVRQVGYLLCYRTNVKELKDQAKELQTTKERIDHEVEAERRNGREIEGDVLRWQESVIETLQEAKQLYEDQGDANVGCSKWPFLNLKSRHQRSRKAKKMANAIDEMKGKNFDKGVGYATHVDIIDNFSATRGSDELKSRNSVKEDVVLSLKDPKVSKIGVYGISGVGKTTLVKEVAKQVKDGKLFDAVVMVTISQTNLERIQDQIAEQLGLCLEETSSSIGRANRLCQRIKKEKTILIILDDLWEKIDLDKLGIPSLDTGGKINSEKVVVPIKDDSKGCKLLLTSRSQDILQKNDTQKNFPLQVLNGEESWSLFEAMAGDVVKDVNVQTLATQVAQRCAGLPVLIVTIAKSLQDKNIYYWKDTLNNLETVDNRDMHDTLFSALEFNFNRLEDEVKEVFLLCGMHGTSIFVSDLLKYVIGLGIFKSTNTIEGARNRLYRIIDDLKASCLLVDDDARAEMIKMHDIVREVAVLIASKHVFTRSNTKWQEWPRKDIPERCTHIILDHCYIQKLPERLDCPHLTFLHIDSTDNRTLEIPDSFFEGMGNLEALDLTGIIISILPISLRFLTKLKTLCLDQCSLKDLTGIGALVNLEILSLMHSSMERFPSEIEQLTKLRMLDLSNSGIGATLPNILCKLTRIEELYMGNATVNWEVKRSAKQKINASLAKLGHLTSLATLEIQIREAWLLPKDIPFDKLERYKVVIGDKWEWSDSKETSRLLKVKLDTNSRWEQGMIKTLIKRVEDLYLDEISGISSVLFELKDEGFPLLKHLHIQNNGEIQHVINSMGRTQTHVLFPKLETLILHNLNNLVKLCHGPGSDNSFGKLKVVIIKSCDQLVYLFSTSMVNAFSQLVEIEVSECSSMKKIVSIESADSDKTMDDKIEFLPLRSLTLQHLPTIDDFCSLRTKQSSLRGHIPTPFFSAKVKFSNLETLKLSSVNLKKIWDDNQSSTPYLVQNLANLTIEDCSGLKYLFSSSMVRRLLNLKQLEISKCDMMEEIIATEETNGNAPAEVLFPKLETIIVKDMQNLKTMWHLILASNSLACFKTLKVKNCEKIEKIFPEYMSGAFATLETLKVKDCKSVQEVFQLGVNANYATQLKYITLLRLPQLKQIWSRGSRSSIHFENMQVVRVEDCEDLEYIFPFSIAKHLPQLEEITIKNAEKMKEIVSKREEPLDNPFKFEFNQLTSMVLWNLHNLQGFCAENHSLSCSSLKELDVYDCEKLKLFKTQDTNSQGRLSNGNLLHVSMHQPLFTLEEVIDNLEDLSLNNEDASLIFQSQVPRDQFRKLNFLRLSELENAQSTSPYWFLQNISSLEWVVIQENSFKVIFPDERPQDEDGEIEIKTRLKKLTLYKLYELQYICKEGCKLDPVLDVLEYLDVDLCSNLRHLVPSSVTLNHLTYLEVQNCSGLIDVITSSTARSLVKLTTLKIRECDLVEQIVVKEGGESNSEIEFTSLEALELDSLPKLNSFGSSNCFLKLPLLEKLVIRQCPRMNTFSASSTSAPLLREILTDDQDEKWFCDGDLNSTVKKIFQHMVAFRSLELLELSQYPELKQVWYSHNVQLGVFGNLKNVTVKDCDFLSDVFLPLNLLQGLPNLQEVDVSDCDSLEAVFDVTNMNEMENFHLKTITLSRLTGLKHIWKQNSHQIVTFDNSQGFKISRIEGTREKAKEDKVDFQHQQQESLIGQVLLPKLETIIIEEMENLETIWHPVLTPKSMGSFETLKVKNCGKIQHIFPIYMHGAFETLETLKVKDCNSVQEIFQLGFNEMSSGDDTTRLKNITLLRLPKLKQIWDRDPQSSLCFKNLQVVRVEDCDDLEYLFPFSITMNLPLLEQITVKQAQRLMKIVSKREEPLDKPVKFEFKALTSLVLWNLDSLERFCMGNHSLVCPSLKELDVCKCVKLKLLNTQTVSSQGRLCHDNLQVSMQQPNFAFEEVIGNLEKLVLSGDDVMRIILQGKFSGEHFSKLRLLCLTKFEDDQTTFPYWFLQNMNNLEDLIVEWSSFKEIFPEEGPINLQGKIENTTRIKKLTLKELHELQHICKEGCQVDPVLEVLEYLDVDECSGLKLLVPSSLTFNHLTYLEVQNCKGLIYLITSSTARSLVNLTTLKIRDCDSVEEIVVEKGRDSINEITFYSLEFLELDGLPKLQMFSSSNCLLKLPLLEKLVIRRCPRMTSFSAMKTIAPLLQKILIDEQDGIWCWEGDLTRTVNRMFQDMVAFYSFEHLELSEYPELRKWWYSPVQQEIFGNLKDLEVHNCDFLSDVLLPSTLLQVLSSLEDLEVSGCASLEALFDLTNMNEKKTIRLKRITLSSLPNLKHIWKQNSREIVSFDHLGDISSDNCQVLRISEIQSFQETTEVQDEGDVQHQQPVSLIEQVYLPKLETLTIEDMENLETIWHPALTPNSMRSFETLKVKNCEKIENIFPIYMHGAFVSLETLKVKDCNSMQEIFQLGVKDMRSGDDTTQLQNIKLLRLPKLKHIWSNPQSSLCFKNVQVVHVEDCDDLEYLFPFSIAMNLPLLEQITIKSAERMKEIVSNREEPLDNPVKFEFKALTSLVLWYLDDLERFCAGNHSLACHSLKELDVFKCMKLKLFNTLGVSSRGRLSDANLQFSMQQPLFTLEEVIGNLEKLALSSDDVSILLQGQCSGEHFSKLKHLCLTKFEDDQTTFPYWFLQNMTDLDHLIVEWSSFKDIFPEVLINLEGKIENTTRIRKLTLKELHELQHICKEGCQTDPILEVLEYLDVDECSNLKYLVPSSVTFNYLEYLEVQNCKGLIYLITSSTARSLVKLTTMKIRECDSVEQIVEEAAGGESINEITFKSLEVLELEFLPKLKMFCSSDNCWLKLPALEKLVIRQCARMESFSVSDISAPLLREILIDEQDEKWLCESGLNSTVNKMFQDKVAFRSVKYLELSEYPELRELWCSRVDQLGYFCNLKNLVVQRCDFLSYVLLPLNLLQALSNLEELKVSECDSLEAVFDLTNMNDRGMSAKVIICLKTIELSGLPKLKQIWKINSQAVVVLEEEEEEDDDDDDDDDEDEEEEEEDDDEDEDEDEDDDEEEEDNDDGGVEEEEEEEEDNEGDIQHEQPATFHQVYLPKLETLTIEDMESLETIWHPVLTPNSMASFETLKVKNCGKIENIFPIYMHGAFATLETLKVKDCNSVQEIFQLDVKDMHNGDDTTRVKNIALLRLPKLKQIWSRDPQSCLYFKNIQVVRIEDCEELEYVFPFSISMNLPLLEQITIKQARRLKEIVSRGEEALDNLVKFEFKSLNSLVIWNLDDLEGFCAGNHSLACHSLKELYVFKCMKLKLFNIQAVISQGRLSDGNPQVSMQQPLFPLEEVMGNLEQLALSSEHVSTILQGHFSGEQFRKLKILTLQEIKDDQMTFPYWFLQNISSLEQLMVRSSSFKEIFPEELPMDHKRKLEITTRIQYLSLFGLHELVHICKEGCQIDPILEVLEYLDVDECSNLKHLVPSSVTFNHLTYLEVENCKGLIYLITSSTARSLVKLTKLKIRECDSVGLIVAEERGESINEIAFNSLQVLKLESLPKLKMFCSSNCFLKLPRLKKLVIRQCPRMKGFSERDTIAPLVREILTDEQDEKWVLEGDLNRTVNRMFRDKLQVAFCSLERLELSRYPELGDVWYNNVQHELFVNLKMLVVHKCDFLSKVLLPLNLLKMLSNLETLEVSECDSLEALIELPNMNEGRIMEKVTIHLKIINLSCLPELKHIWTQNSQEIVSFENFGVISSDNSQELHTSRIQDFRKTTEEGNIHHQQPTYSIGQVLFPNLETITIKDMLKLKTIWHPFFTSNSMNSLKTMQVSKCLKLDNIFPTYMEKAFTSLETLMVSDCNSVQVIFEFNSETGGAEDTARLQKLTLLRLSKLKQIWSKDPKENLPFHQLQHVCVESCNKLEYLFPLSIAMHAIHLEVITIKNAERMKQIVSEKEGILDNPVKFEFNHLTSLVLWSLKEMEGFFAGSHSLICPLLRELDIRTCAKVKLFKTQCWSSQGRVSMQQPLFTLEEVICKLEKLALNSEDADIILLGQLSSEHFAKLKVLCLTRFKDDHANFPYWFLQKLTSLETLLVEWSSFKEIFPEVIPADEKGKFEIRSRIKKLSLNQLHELRHICKEGFQMDPILEVLENLWVKHCPNMKQLAPSSVTFCQLTYLEVQNCIGLIDLVTSSTARSLVRLTTLKIRDCNSLAQVVSKERDEAKDEITFMSLKYLELQCLPKIKCFCSTKCFLNFPLLEKVVVKQCPRMNIFTTSDTSAPKLRKILSKEEDEKLYWDGDLNRTINKMFVDMVAFRSFSHLELSQYPELGELWCSHVQPGVFGNLKDLIVQKFDFSSDVLLPLNLVQALSNLEKLQVSECDSLVAVFDLSNKNGNEVLVSETIQLQSITLSSLPKLKHIWKQNIQEIDSFRETTEEGYIQHRQPAYSSGQVVLPNLETLIIKEMQNLETVWHPILCPTSMGSFKTLELNKCGKVENICPLYMEGAFTSLETLMVTECSSVKEIFQLGIKDEDTAQLMNMTLLRLPQLKQIWSREHQTSLHFCKLKVLRVEHCNALEHLLPFYIAMGLLQIEQITIKYAGKMKEIVSGKEGPIDCPPKFEFNRMSSLVLWNSPEIQGFFSTNHSVACPSLKILDVRNCLKWSLFEKQGTTGEGKVLGSNLQILRQPPPFPLKEVICNLEKLALNYEDASVIVQGQFSRDQFCKLKSLILSKFEDEQARFPYWFLQNIINLEVMVVEQSSFKEIFQHEGQNEIQTRIKRLTLNQLHELLDICKEGFQIDPTLEVVEYLFVQHCSKLKHLVPSSVIFSHLTYLEVQNCNGLLHLITSSTARSLIKLTTMKIRACNSLEQVMPEETEETVNEITFNSLQVLELECLLRFKIFSSGKCVLKLPLLTKLIVVQCPRMMSFSVSDTSAPKLKKILTDKQDGRWCWEGDLNRTVEKIFQDMVAFSSFNHLEFSKYPELKELWYGQAGQKIFCNLKHLVVCKCSFLSKMIFSSNLLQLLYTLEELEVIECDSLEVIFDVKALDEKAMESKEVSRLKKLTVSGLPNLKRIWNREAGEIISFRNLQIMKVDKCQHLKNLFSVSLCQDLIQLEELRIESCGVEEIVSIEEGLEELKFDFPQLKILRLFNLTQLVNFCPKGCTLECPSLKMLNVRGCEELQIFAFDHLNSQLLREGDLELQIEQALFSIDKVSQILEDLSLNEKDAMRILNGNYEKNLFQRIKILRLQHFQETPIKFLNDLIRKFPATTTLQVRHSSFEILFPSEKIGHCSIEVPAQIKNLWLFQFEQLKHIWNDDDLALHPLVQNLENLSIMECSGIIRLAPASASFKNLTSLKVKDCNGLMYFMTSCSAKSLVCLTSLSVSNCEMLEEIVITHEGELEEEITFESLKYLEITCLSSFKSFCSGKHTFILPSLVTLKVIGCHKVQNFSSGVIIAPFLKLVEVENGKKQWKGDLNTTIEQLFIHKAIGEGVEGDYKESSIVNIQSGQMHQKSASTTSALSSEEHGAESKADEIVDSGKKEIYKLPISHTAIGTEERSGTIQTPLTEAVESTFTQTSVQKTALGTQDETIEGPLVQATHQGMLSPSIVQDTEKLHSDTRIQEMHKTLEKALVPVAQNVQSSSMVENIDGSQDLPLHPGENLLIRATTSIMNDYEENTGPKEMHEIIQRPLVQNTEDMLIPASVNIAIGTHAMHENIDKPFIQAAQNPGGTTIKYEKAVGTQETYESKRRFSVHDAQNVFSPPMVYDTGKLDDPEIILGNKLSYQTTISVMAENRAPIDPTPSQVSRATSSSTTLVADVCNSFKEVDIFTQLLPYFEAGVKRHPQVLDWLNTKRRRVFASSFFFLFAEVTRILRTTRRVNLTEDDQNYIRECCSVLQGVGFDDSWISYVHGCIEECGDGEDLERKVEEAEGQASNLKAQLESIKKELASVEESLVLLRDKTSRLHDFIEF